MTRHAKPVISKKRVPSLGSTWAQLRSNDAEKSAGTSSASTDEAKEGKKLKTKKNTNEEEEPQTAASADGKEKAVNFYKMRRELIGCFRCGEKGHMLKNCPLVSEDKVETDICYKCGSTEHKSRECKIKTTDSYPFATCLICNKTGHIAKLCPQNEKGIYPFGGECLNCKSKDHYQDDCPTSTKRKKVEEGSAIERIDNSQSADAALVDEDEDEPQPKQKKLKANKNPKVVKF